MEASQIIELQKEEKLKPRSVEVNEGHYYPAKGTQNLLAAFFPPVQKNFDKSSKKHR